MLIPAQAEAEERQTIVSKQKRKKKCVDEMEEPLYEEVCV